MTRPHHPARRLHALAYARGVNAGCLRILKNARAVFFGVRREAERIVERMNVERLRKMQALEIIPAAQHLANLVGRPSLDIRAEIDAEHRGMLDESRLVVGAPHRELPLAR